MHVCVCLCTHSCSLENNFLKHVLGPPGSTVARNPPANAGDTGMIPGLGRSHMLWGNSHDYWAGVLQLLKPAHLEPVLTREVTAVRSPCTSNWRLVPTHCNERKPACSNEDAVQAKKKFFFTHDENKHTHKSKTWSCVTDFLQILIQELPQMFS